VRRVAASPLLLTLAAVGVALVVGYKLPDLIATYGPRDLLFFLAAASLAGLGLRSPSFSIISVVAVFVFSALLRRLAPAVDPSSDLAAIVPFVVALPLAARGLLAAKPISVSLLVAWMTLSAGLALSAPLVGIAGWLNVAVPLLAAFGAAHVANGLRTLARATVVCGALAATYGIVQYFVAFPWDAAWLASTNFASVGSFDDPSFRPFATLPAPATAATVSALVILLLITRRDLTNFSTLVRGWALSSSVMLLLLAQVRSVWLALGVAILVRALAASDRSLRQIAAPVAIVMAVVLFSPQREVLIGRAQTFTELGTDASYQSRVGLLSGTGQLVSPLGAGLGAYSSGSRAASNSSVDNGYLIVLGETGIVGFGLLVWVLAVVVRKARRPDYPFVALLIVLNAAGFALGNFAGMLLWAFSGINRTGDEQVSEAQEPLAAQSR
jgi:hypothetical protein